jgi:hypothetical protein
MAKAIFAVPFIDNNPQIDMGIVQGIPPVPNGYGYSCIGQVPQAPTGLVLIETSEDILDMLADHPDYLFVEDVIDG